ncbi:pentapeptide repeat-containing protein [Nitrospina watsonii]|uniref:Pentapeptide repeat-containing protein n=1 Tax=Nitrospina watsonii TaxID=1323948 RepID=A0ABM9HBG9_9BACT|nr:pentapeptide repeat-containing protein [Nitrospina watsonii]CAI2717438.1 conserved membrane protein of unknown function [Nitrospina watsonii]
MNSPDSSHIEKPSPSANTPSALDNTYETIKARHDEISRNIRSVTLALMSYALFCFLTLGQSDDIAFKETGKIQIPFSGGIDVNFSTFFLAGPVLLIVLTFYLHIFVHELQRCELEASRKLPYVFNLDNPFARGITFFIFYFLTPAVFFAFIWSIRASESVTFWSLVALGVCLVLVWLFHCASNVKSRSIKKQPLPLMILLAVFIVSAVPGNLNFFGPIQIVKSDLKSANFQKHRLDRMNADFAHLEQADFSQNQNVRKAFFNSAFLEQADFSGANLSESSFRKSDLTQARFKGSKLNGAGFQQAQLIETDFSPLSISIEKERHGFSFASLFKSSGRQTQSPGREASELNQTRKDPAPTISENDSQPETRTQSDQSSAQPQALAAKSTVPNRTLLKNADFNQALLHKTKMSSANLEGATFLNATIESSLFDNATLTRVTFSENRITGTLFQKARMDSSKFIHTVIEDTRFNEANLERSLFDKTFLTNINFTGANLSFSSFFETEFDNVDFSEAVLEGADLSGSSFYQTHFENTNMRRVALNIADLTGNSVLNTDFSGADLAGTIFYNANLTGSLFQGADLDSAEFGGANLKFADFREARNLRNAAGGVMASLKHAENWKKALYDDDIRKDLGIGDKALKHAIVLFVDHHFSSSPPDQKHGIMQDIEKQYGLSANSGQGVTMNLKPLGRNPDITNVTNASPRGSAAP